MTPQDVEEILIRYFVNGDRSEDVAQISEPELDVDTTVIDLIIKEPVIHDEDYRIFKHFADARSTILDIGANFGYSATAIWRVGSKAAIASFEPIKGYAPILAELGRRKNPGTLKKLFKSRRYESYTTGISDDEGRLEFYMSVINGKIHSALTTADKSPHIESYVRNTVDYVSSYIGEVNSFRIFAFTSPVTTIDRWMASGLSRLNLGSIVAMKIDTEGYEGRVLVGASQLLQRQKPLIIAECGHVIDLAVKAAFDHGYVFAEREGDQLRVSDVPTKRVNGFFIHPNRFGYYKRIGLMSD